MNRSIALLAVLGSALVMTSSAQTAAPAAAPAGAVQPAKVAVIAFQIAVAQTNEGQRDFADLQKKYEPRQTKLKALSDATASLQSELATFDAINSVIGKVDNVLVIAQKVITAAAKVIPV